MKDIRSDVVTRLLEFMENEARSCSMDFGCITPLYVYRMWGGVIPMADIEKGLMELRASISSPPSTPLSI